MSIPIGTSPHLLLFSMLHLKILKSIIILLFARKENKPKNLVNNNICDDTHPDI
jgi:hypothetical protein